jgi:pyruvate dehydrogenase E1 component
VCSSDLLRLSTRPLAQPARALSASLAEDVIAGGYWLRPPAPGAELAIVYSGAVAAEALAAHQEILDDLPGAGLLAVTSADRLNAGWHAAEQARRDAGRDGAAAGGAVTGGRDTLAPVEHLLAPLAPDATLVTVVDGHPATLSWLGAVRGHTVQALGVEHFGQSGDLDDLYRHYHIDAAAILDACAAACLARVV